MSSVPNSLDENSVVLPKCYVFKQIVAKLGFSYKIFQHTASISSEHHVAKTSIDI